MLQSEIFERLLEEAEQMHIKRKEATEMLKVQQRPQSRFSEKFKIVVIIQEYKVVHGHCVCNVSVGNITKQFIHAFSCVSWSSNALKKFREHSRKYSCSRLGFEQPLRFFRVLLTRIMSRPYSLVCSSLDTK